MSTRSSRLGGLPAWARRPALTVTLLVVAVAVSVAQGQPSPSSRPSGVSVPVRADPPTRPPAMGTLLLVTEGRQLVRFDTLTRKAAPVPLPRGVAALRAWAVGDDVLVLGRPLTGRTAAWVVRPGRRPRLLGPADAVVPTGDGAAAWLAVGGRATRVSITGARRPLQVRLPPGARLVGAAARGLIVTTGAVQPADAPPPTATPFPSVTVTVPVTSPGTSAGPGPTPSGTPTTPGPTPVPTRTLATTQDGYPLTTMLVGGTGRVRFLAEAEALAVAGGRVLLRRDDRRLGVLDLRRTLTAAPQWLPGLSAVEVTGPAAVYPDGSTFAVLARVNEHARLVVGPTDTPAEADLHVVALDGGPPALNPAPPAFTASGRVLVSRPDGKVVYYLLGDRSGTLLGADLPAAVEVSQA